MAAAIEKSEIAEEQEIQTRTTDLYKNIRWRLLYSPSEIVHIVSYHNIQTTITYALRGHSDNSDYAGTLQEHGRPNLTTEPSYLADLLYWARRATEPVFGDQDATGYGRSSVERKEKGYSKEP